MCNQIPKIVTTSQNDQSPVLKILVKPILNFRHYNHVPNQKYNDEKYITPTAPVSLFSSQFDVSNLELQIPNLEVQIMTPTSSLSS